MQNSGDCVKFIDPKDSKSSARILVSMASNLREEAYQATENAKGKYGNAAISKKWNTFLKQCVMTDKMSA